MICMCCGFGIQDEFHRTSQGNICDRCWNDPNLFFPEKIRSTDQGAKLLDFYTNEVKSHKILVIKLNQKNVELYSGKLKIRQLLNLYAIHSFEEETLEGYQRELYDDQVSELFNYLIECPIAIMPGILISVRDGLSFTRMSLEQDTSSDEFGTLEIPVKKGAMWIIDGQHRVNTFEKFLASIGQFTDKKSYNEQLKTFLDYEIPVTFVDSKQAADIINESDNLKLNPSDVERAVFYIINKTQKRLSPSLTDSLQYIIKNSGINGIPSIEKDAWRAKATFLGISLNIDPSSSLYKQINISGIRGLNRPLQLNSFVSSLKPLFGNEKYINLPEIKQKELLHNYWNSIKEINKEAFKKDVYRKYLLLKTIGVYTLNLLFVDYIEEYPDNFEEVKNIKNFVNKMKGFDWKKDSSLIANFGGMKGVREAHKIVTEHIKHNTMVNL